MIKNAKELVGDSKESFRRAYIEYFKDACIFYKYKHLPKSFNKALLRFNAEKYADEMLRRIDTEENRVSYVSMLGTEIDAFMTAYTEGSTATISHIFCRSGEQNKYRNIKLLNIYKTLVRQLQVMGATTVQVKSSLDDPVLIDILESLNFEEGNISPTEVEYSKRIPIEDEEKSHGTI